MQTKTKLTLSITLVSMVLGLMISLQYRQTEASRLIGSVLTPSDTEEKQLSAQLKAVKSANDEAQQQLAKITASLTAYEKQTAGSNGNLKQLQQQLEDERILAGLTPVTGPGVTVTIMDGIATGNDVEQVLTHDWNVRSVVNELFTAGAEAVSINGYRVVATSGVFCRGPVVSVNDHRLGAPFTVTAIGDPQALKSALTIQGGIIDLLRANGLRVSDPQIEQSVNMPAFTGATSTTQTGS